MGVVTIKNFIKIIACISLSIITAFSCISAQGKTTAVSKKSVPNINYSSSLLYVNKKYIVANEKGIFVSNKPTSKWKRITSKYNSTGELFISDGKTVYFNTCSGYDPDHYKSSVYSIKTNGKKLKKIKKLKGSVNIIAAYKGNLYIENSPQGMLYYGHNKILRINLKSGKTKCISKNYDAGRCSYLNGRIYFSKFIAVAEFNNQNATYCLNLKNYKIKKVAKRLNAYSLSNAESPLCFLSYYCDDKKGCTTKNYIYSINSKHKIIKSKKLPDDFGTGYVSKNGKYVYYSNINLSKDVYYRQNLKTGVKKKITGPKKFPYNIIGDCKSSDIYFIYNNSDKYINKLSIYKLSGLKLIPLKINGAKTITLKDVYLNNSWTHGNYWISGKNLITTEKGKIKSYSLSK